MIDDATAFADDYVPKISMSFDDVTSANSDVTSHDKSSEVSEYDYTKGNCLYTILMVFVCAIYLFESMGHDGNLFEKIENW